MLFAWSVFLRATGSIAKVFLKWGAQLHGLFKSKKMLLDKYSGMIAAAIGVAGTLLGTGIGAMATLKSQSLQAQSELAVQCEATVLKREETVRLRAESYLVAISELIAFFQENTRAEVRQAREKISDVQKAAFALSAYAGQDLSMKSIAIIPAIEAAMLPESVHQLQTSVANLTASVVAWRQSFHYELKSLEEARYSCRSPA